MLLRALFLLALILPYPFAHAQSVKSNLPFSESLLTAPGVNYYPHQWPEDQWEKDLKNMASMGIEFVNVGDQAWASWQKSEGVAQLAGLEKVVSLAEQAGLEVVITIPIMDAPAWLRSSYENIANVGIPQLSNEVYHAAVQTLVKGMARKFANNDAVAGFIIPSLSKEQWEGIDRSQFSQKLFQEYLERNYRSIDSLNTAWGMAFVGETYSSFGEINLPIKGNIEHPLMNLSYRQFRADELQSFLQDQIKELAAYIPENQWISLHVKEMASFQNPWEYEKLDFLSWSRSNDFIGYADAFEMGVSTAFSNAFFQSTGSLGFSEQGTNRYIPSTQRLALYNALASGNQFMSPYRYRQPSFHIGSAEAALVKRDGKSLTAYGETYKQFMGELKLIRDKYPKLVETPAAIKSRNTAILYSPQLLRNASYQNEEEGWDYENHLAGYHKVLRSMGCPVSFIQGNQDFFKYKVLIVAGYEHIDERLVKRLEDFAKKGGNVIFTARSASKDASGSYLAKGPSSPIEKLIGAKVVHTDQIPGTGQSKINHKGQSYKWSSWGEVLELSGSIPLATHGAQYYSGRAAASFKTLSRGSISYFGFDTDEKLLEQALVRKIFERMRLSFDRMEMGMIKAWRDGFWFGMNFGKENQRVPMDPYNTMYVGTLDLGRGEVNVWRERVQDESTKTKVSNISTKSKTPVTASKDAPKEKNAKNKKVKDKKVNEKAAGEKSLFEQTIQNRKKKNN